MDEKIVDVAELEGEEVQGRRPRRKYCPVLVDGEKYHFDHSPVTGGEIMDSAGIPHSVGLLQILPDGTQRPAGVDEEIKLPRRGRQGKPCRRFLKRVRFKRG